MCLKANQLADSRAGVQFNSQTAQAHLLYPLLLRLETGSTAYGPAFNFTFFGAISQPVHRSFMELV